MVGLALVRYPMPWKHNQTCMWVSCARWILNVECRPNFGLIFECRLQKMGQCRVSEITLSWVLLYDCILQHMLTLSILHRVFSNQSKEGSIISCITCIRAINLAFLKKWFLKINIKHKRRGYRPCSQVKISSLMISNICIVL